MSQGQQLFKAAVQEYLLCTCYSLSEVKGLVAQLWPTICDPMDCSLPVSFVHGILQARILEWVAILLSRGSSPPRDKTCVSCIVGRYFTIWATKEKLQHRTNGSFISLFTWRRKWQPTPVFLPGQSHGRGAWWATIHGVTIVGHDLATKPPPPPFILNTICLIRTLWFKQRYLGHKSIHIYWFLDINVRCVGRHPHMHNIHTYLTNQSKVLNKGSALMTETHLGSGVRLPGLNPDSLFMSCHLTLYQIFIFNVCKVGIAYNLLWSISRSVMSDSLQPCDL